MGKPACCEKNGLKKGPWTAEEDQKLLHYIHNHGYQKWRTVPKNAGLQRCGKSCRLRWTNYLRPDIKRGKFSLQEEGTIIQLHSVLGNKWSTIASSLPGRTDNEIKNYWNTNLRKKLVKQGIDPVTHRPRLDLLQLFSLPTSSSSLYNSPQQLNIQNLSQIQNTLNIPNFLDLVPSLASFQSKNLQNYPKNLQHNHFSDSQVQCEEFQAWTTSINSNASLFGNTRNALLMQPSMKQFSNALPNFSDTYNGYRATYMGQSAVSPPGVINCINMDPTLGELLSADQNKMFESNDNATNFELGSVMLTPSCSKSPLNSSRTHVNGSHEDHEDSHCSNVLFDLPAGFYFDGFM